MNLIRLPFPSPFLLLYLYHNAGCMKSSLFIQELP